ncbi:MAG: zf-TFIIB domain-containing protein, partial [Caulobacterales bacterium]
MPLLVCPSCDTKAPMQAVQRHSVEFDVCTSCRGVWFDRGELEKLLESTRQDRSSFVEERRSFDRDRDEFY